MSLTVLPALLFPVLVPPVVLVKSSVVLGWRRAPITLRALICWPMLKTEPSLEPVVQRAPHWDEWVPAVHEVAAAAAEDWRRGMMVS